MDNPVGKAVLYLFAGAYISLLAISGYAAVWERQQPQKSIRAVVESRRDYAAYNEISGTRQKVRIMLRGVDQPVYFSRSDVDGKIARGNEVDAIVRNSFPLSGNSLDGLVIKVFQ